MNNEKITYQKYPSLQYESYAWDTPTQAQKDSIKNLVEILKAKYNLSDNDVYKHDDISPQKVRGKAKGLHEKE
ncbi:peptidoglycan recognition protein family protein [Helicobacter trogontum]|uniref:N-acetylmuramoyl-L-alanine amidase n=1 Tax=Helicobacter trogontum TaxID=50960 RepID=A0A4U8S641_9HELI|nr:N-acetylmuramoyl-L-alanine amidase [Helicobacter trogontum]TLD81344.1 N-acetylmuramoyl-L-alanine amidase [Helicobacter trogontum]